MHPSILYFLFPLYSGALYFVHNGLYGTNARNAYETCIRYSYDFRSPCLMFSFALAKFQIDRIILDEIFGQSNGC